MHRNKVKSLVSCKGYLCPVIGVVMRTQRENGLHYTPSVHGATSNCQALCGFHVRGNQQGLLYLDKIG
jgi:hypothetical protein